jgi:hypothetical protein
MRKRIFDCFTFFDEQKARPPAGSFLERMCDRFGVRALS